MKVLRITRHAASEKQLAELVRIFGKPCDVISVSETIPNVERVIELITLHNADVLEAVLSLPLLAEFELLPEVKIPVIRAVMNRAIDTAGNVTFEFDHYERIHRVIVETERL